MIISRRRAIRLDLRLTHNRKNSMSNEINGLIEIHLGKSLTNWTTTS